MDQEKLLAQLSRNYVSRRSMLSRLPLGIQPEAIWQELLNVRRSSCTALPLYNHRGTPYWYVTTDRMIAASEKIVETLYENDTEYDLYTEPPPITTLEEVFYTSYVEGLQITMQNAMDFLAADRPAEGIGEQLIFNNRYAGSYAGRSLYRGIDAALLHELAGILTEGMDQGGPEYRTADTTDFASPDGEVFPFPSARTVPERVNELCLFLSAPQAHPLVKAAVSQAYMMILRPFPEGNDRLGRILSNMILLRSGYSVFGEVSLSALIARRNYAYYEATANILREENGGDLTYFVEYYIELLSRALDERRLRRQRQEEQALQAEAEMARIPLAPDSPSPLLPDGGAPPVTFLTDGNRIMDGMQPVSVSDTGPDGKEPREILMQYAANPASVIGQVSVILLRKLDAGQNVFNMADITEELNVTTRQLIKPIYFLKRNGVLRDAYELNGKKYYQFCSAVEPSAYPSPSPSGEQGFCQEVCDRLDFMIHSFSARDKRIGEAVRSCLARGKITVDDYAARGNSAKWETDMQLAAQMGLVRKVTSQCYSIPTDIQPEPALLSKGQKKFISDVYASFGAESFSVGMVVATLDYSDSAVSAYLHRFTLMKILVCRKEGVNQYRFIVTPEEHPEYFDPAA